MLGLGMVLALSACSAAQPNTAPTTVIVTKGNGSTVTTTTTPPSSASASSSSKPAKPKKPVHIKLLNLDGSTYGVGMPLIAFFSRRIHDAKPLQQITKATVNGKPIKGAWYFETSSYYKGYPLEAHFRPQNFWPAHSRIFIKIPAKGVSAGKNLAFDDSLTSEWTTGPRNIGVVDDSTHKLKITSDGKHWGTFPVSLGEAKTPTKRGIKVIMEKGRDISMKGPGYYDPHVKFTQRLTYDGEYLHAAPWNCTSGPGCTGPQNNIGHGDSSNGCTNLTPSDAQKLYNFLRVGDVIEYPNASGPQMQLGEGYGDWNIDWSIWQTGGLVSTT